MTFGDSDSGRLFMSPDKGPCSLVHAAGFCGFCTSSSQIPECDTSRSTQSYFCGCCPNANHQTVRKHMSDTADDSTGTKRNVQSQQQGQDPAEREIASRNAHSAAAAFRTPSSTATEGQRGTQAQSHTSSVSSCCQAHCAGEKGADVSVIS